LISHFNFLANANVEINNPSLSNSTADSANMFRIINVPDTMNAIHAVVEGINAITPQNKPFDPVQFLTDSKKVLQRVNAVVKLIGTIFNISSVFGVPLDASPLIALIPEVILAHLLSCTKTKYMKTFAER
jgi:hypothetical protein